MLWVLLARLALSVFLLTMFYLLPHRILSKMLLVYSLKAPRSFQAFLMLLSLPEMPSSHLPLELNPHKGVGAPLGRVQRRDELGDRVDARGVVPGLRLGGRSGSPKEA